MHLALYLAEHGIQHGSWRHPRAGHVAPLDFGFYRHWAQRAEAACLDLVFLADKLSIDDVYGGSVRAAVESRALPQHAEPLSVMAALAGVTSRIGLAATVSATYTQPYTAARMLATIDHLSGGRVAWNVVTSVSDGEARNHGLDRHLGHDARYEKAAEFTALLKSLWDSWSPDWRIADRASGRYGDASRVRSVDHDGRWFKVKGPLNVPRPPQGHPVQVQAGVSGNFERTALAQAEVLFTVQPDRARAADFRQRFRGELAAAGRNPDSVRILPGIVPVVGATTREAQELSDELKALVLPEAALSFMSASMNHDLAQYPLHGPVPDIADQLSGSRGRFEPVLRQAREAGWTLAQLGTWYAGGLGFLSPVGTAEAVADTLIDWVQAGAADGFVVIPALMPVGAADLLDHVVPILQARGAFRTAYPGRTLRDTLGLAVPANPFDAAAASAS